MSSPYPGTAVVFARHARTEWNATGRFQGWADVPLDGVGASQAAALADQLAVLGPSRVLSSDLARARATAEAVATAAGLGVEVDPDLREVNVGAWEGLTADEVAARWPKEYRAWTAGQDVARGGGETLAAAGRRMAAAVVRAAGGYPGVSTGGTVPGPTVIVSHGMVIRSALRRLAARGFVAVPGDEIPHLGNARWIETTVRVSPEREVAPVPPV